MVNDWVEWHTLYATEPVLKQRLRLVQQFLATALLASPPGLIRLVSICAGDGRDVIGTLYDHPRRRDVYGRLVELNPELVAQGRSRLHEARLEKQLTFLQTDATQSSSYSGVVPAQIVLVCGVLGNLPDRAELIRLIDHLSFLVTNSLSGK